jgi:DNA polymerase elongation subunit (family B)
MYYTNVVGIGNNILLRGIDNGRRVSSRVPYKPTFWIKRGIKKGSISKWKSLENIQLEPLKFDSIYEAREFVKKYDNVENFKIYGQTFFQYAYISENFGSQVKFDPKDIVIATIDIEVGSDNGFPKPEHANQPITAITLHIKNRFNSHTKDGRYFVFGCKDYNNTREDVVYYQYLDEQNLINGFISVWKEHYPDIVTGWNIEKFDFPYIINRMKRLFMEDEIKKLSPWSKVQERMVLDDKFGGEKVQVYDIYGVSTIDYLRLYKKHSKTPNQESYTLDHIAFVELKERKLAFKGRLHDLYLNDHQKFIEYNIKDVTLVIKLNDKLRLLELAMTLAYDNKVNFNDVFSQVRMWDSITANHLFKKGIAIPPNQKREKKEEYAGAYVKEPKAGRYSYIASWDLDGLYPHLIMMMNIGPETLVDPKTLGGEFYQWWATHAHMIDVESILNRKTDLSVLKEHNVGITPNRQLFSREKQGFLAELMESMYDDRKKFKKEMIEAQKELEEIEAEMKRRGLKIHK